MNGKVILIVEDDRDIRGLLADFLKREGFTVELAEDGTAVDRILARVAPDLVVLDLMLPGEDGLSICRRLRARGATPILMLTAKNDDIDRIVGLELGADDYLGKPFNPRELIARVRAVLRRRAETLPGPSDAKIYRFEGFVADPQARRVTDPRGGDVELTGAEFDLLRTFLERPGRVLSRDQLLDLTRGREGDVLDRSIDVLVSRLRRKLAESGAVQLFKTVRNGGYQLAAKVEVQEAAP